MPSIKRSLALLEEGEPLSFQLQAAFPKWESRMVWHLRAGAPEVPAHAEEEQFFHLWPPSALINPRPPFLATPTPTLQLNELIVPFYHLSLFGWTDLSLKEIKICSAKTSSSLPARWSIFIPLLTLNRQSTRWRLDLILRRWPTSDGDWCVWGCVCACVFVLAFLKKRSRSVSLGSMFEREGGGESWFS